MEKLVQGEVKIGESSAVEVPGGGGEKEMGADRARTSEAIERVTRWSSKLGIWSDLEDMEGTGTWGTVPPLATDASKRDVEELRPGQPWVPQW
jgi:hypothetical protein